MPTLPTMAHLQLPASYDAVVESMKQRIHLTRTQAALAVNAELVILYWEGVFN